MHKYKLITLFLCLSLIQPIVWAKDLYVFVKLTDVKVEKTSDAGGDDIFFNISELDNNGQAKEERVPIYPMHWLSKQLSGVKNVILWQGPIKEDESKKIVFSLIEQKFPPWDLDDFTLGSAELMLWNRKGKLKTKWSIPVIEASAETEILKLANPQRYVFKGAGSRYDVAFRVEQKKQ